MAHLISFLDLLSYFLVGVTTTHLPLSLCHAVAPPPNWLPSPTTRRLPASPRFFSLISPGEPAHRILRCTPNGRRRPHTYVLVAQHRLATHAQTLASSRRAPRVDSSATLVFHALPHGAATPNLRFLVVEVLLRTPPRKSGWTTMLLFEVPRHNSASSTTMPVSYLRCGHGYK
jgi:hypothetical protein